MGTNTTAEPTATAHRSFSVRTQVHPSRPRSMSSIISSSPCETLAPMQMNPGDDPLGTLGVSDTSAGAIAGLSI